MLHPAGYVFPRVVNLPLLAFRDDARRPRDILLLNHAFALHVLVLQLLSVFTRHRYHFQRLLVLSLPPLIESLSTVSSPEHKAKLVAALVLVSCQFLVPRKLTDVLEASLPHGFGDSVGDAL